MKIFNWLKDNILFALTLFLLAFIPLYPKIPILDIKNTWVYVRGDDFMVVIVLVIWAILLLRKKVTLKSPLTLPIFLFWIIGGISTIHGVLLIFPGLANVFPNVAFLSFLRRIEYLSLFFIAFSGIKDKKNINSVIVVLVSTLFLIAFYGLGQKYLGFPAFLTMNEEFAKGIPIQLSSLSRVPSTFSGHYDLAAYLVLVIPIFASLVFGLKKWAAKLILLSAVGLGVILLFMTVSRVSFFVLLVSLVIVLFYQKRKLILFSLPALVILACLILFLTPALVARFGNTIKEIDVLIDATNGEPIGHVKEAGNTYYENKIVKRKIFRGRDDVPNAVKIDEDPEIASTSAVLPYASMSPKIFILSPPNASTGENLPQGTGYINLSLSPVVKRSGEFFYDKATRFKSDSDPADAFVFSGHFLVKRASAYDLSFTTRFQGEWPKAIEAFKRNILLGSGYSSLSLAVDNNYLRILGEIGLLGFASFFVIFLILGIYIRRILPVVDSPVVRSFIIGFAAGVVGLSLNALFIDVFEASKIAYSLWLLVGIILGILQLYKKTSINIAKELKNIVTSPWAIAIYLFTSAFMIFLPMISNYFAGDDFTWFRWAADHPNILNYFTDANGFFYRPGAKLYFLLMYSIFWLNQAVYHIVSIFLHFAIALLVFLLIRRILRNYLFAVLASFLFLIMSGSLEAIFWTSATGFLFTTLFSLLSLFLFILWQEKKKIIYFFASLTCLILGLLFHELGIVTPLLVVLYTVLFSEPTRLREVIKNFHYRLLFLPLVPYFLLRLFAHSHWFSGDYSYNLFKLPFNFIGNILGYFALTFFGPISLPFYQTLRNFSKGNIIIAAVSTLAIAYITFYIYKKVISKIDKEEKKIIYFGLLFFTFSLLPFLGLGNIASRYSYLSSFGLVIILVFLIKKMYEHLKSQGYNIAIAATTIIIILFSLLHIIQIQQRHSDWYEAGKRTEKFFISIDGLYSDYWKDNLMEFHFVNVPTRQGEAWIFPVGLPDALWLLFRNPKIAVYQDKSVKQALDQISDPVQQKVFVFNGDGEVTEVLKILSTQ